jgi:hypothetical protein
VPCPCPAVHVARRPGVTGGAHSPDWSRVRICARRLHASWVLPTRSLGQGLGVVSPAVLLVDRYVAPDWGLTGRRWCGGTEKFRTEHFGSPAGRLDITPTNLVLPVFRVRVQTVSETR